ncbi:putative bifunctional diguanylate cyclase/phosphodiesterase [Rhizobium sp. CF142]|uniref:putative bifunctional diguanylate cyclase/phosphodiesterase n=1 Tax=Rhizobium sp. CF142 TaxID=1144314 RepID=UPI0002D4D397|nr:EAL domain-containing protein [Rhizobium sp. CF142]
MLLAISGLAILGLVFLAAIWAGRESDAAALDRQRQLVNSRLLDQVQRVSQDIQLMGAGYASLLVADSATAGGKSERAGTTSAATFGKIATTVFGYNAAFLVTPAGELALQSDPETKRRFKWVRPLLQPMIQDLEATHHGAPQGPSSDPEPSRVELMRLEGRPSVAGVVSVTGSSKVDPQEGNDANRLYLVAFRFLDGVTLDTLSREQGLAGARYARTADQEQNEVAFEIEATASGDPIGFIIWRPDLPGSRVIGRLVPVLSVAGLVIAGLFFALMGRLRGSLRELSASEHHARHLSLHDVLTGLPNRALFAARFEQCLAAMKSPGELAVLALVDLDKFKEVNDIHGHAAGDELLRDAVDRMNALVERGDTLARLGGDEFALLLPDVRADDDSYILLCNAIIEALSKPFQLRGGDVVVRIGCSIGIAAFHDAAQATSEILRRADVALYEAKTNGRGRLIEYDPSLDHRVEARENLKNDLRLVLEGHTHLPDSVENAHSDDPGHLEVFFQGVHRADAHGKLSGAEALVRWRHPTQGLLSPDKFIPIAEEAGMIDQLGGWVLRNAAKAAASWPADMSIAVNVSPSQIRHRDFDRHVLSILAETGLPPSRLELELTEAALFNIDEIAQGTLGRLRSQGIRIALDDFGTGFSSLSHLIQFNIDRIKIDRSFVRLLGTQAEGAAIVSAILGLSRTLGKATTAEGVETKGQRDFLVAAGCNDLQGFLFSRPLPPADFLASLPSAETMRPQSVAASSPRG